MKSSNGIQPPAAAMRDAIRATSASPGVVGAVEESVVAPGTPGLESCCIE
ncbi:MAG TPA: hypothetical protein VIP05_04825 [Burkholderiaceae bacterium]